MNQGLYGFPSTLGIAAANIISITEFDATGSYLIPANAASLEVLLVGAGGGGAGGAGAAGAASSGGGGGGGGSVVYVNCLVVDDLPSSTLNVTIGSGGLGGSNGVGGGRQATNGGAGGTSIVSSSLGGLFIRAFGGAGGSAASNGVAPNATGNVAVGGAGRSSSIGFVQTTNFSGQNGGLSTLHNSYTISDARCNGGAGGGSTIAAGPAAFTGGSIELGTSNSTTNLIPVAFHINLPLVGNALGNTAAYGGNINAGPTLGAGNNSRYMIGNSIKQYGGGIGGAGGGASISGTVTLGGGNGGNGWRGGGGGGGGASRVNGVPGGTGGIGGNGYCCIIARA